MRRQVVDEWLKTPSKFQINATLAHTTPVKPIKPICQSVSERVHLESLELIPRNCVLDLKLPGSFSEADLSESF